MRLITGPVDKYRNLKHLKHLLHLRSMQDHRGFNSQITFLIDQEFIIRLTVFSGIKDGAIFHSLHRIFNVPAGFLCPAQANRIQCIKRIK